MPTRAYSPEGWPVLIPRLVADDPERLVVFIREVFGATGDYQPRRPTELFIDGSMLMVGTALERERMPAFLYLYVEDTDATHRRAIERGATSIEAPADMPYGDRRAMLRDLEGNVWQIATHGGRFTP
jgi:uncharacterized glyoxalase superfamily protein PhnB